MAVPLIFQPLVKYAQFEGRARRSEFWLWVLFRIVVGILMALLSLAFLVPFFSHLAASHQQEMSEAQAMDMVGNMFRAYSLYMLVWLGLLLPTIAVGVRRLHDINRTGLWLLMPVAVAFGGIIIVIILGAVLAVGVAAGHAANGGNAPAAGALAGIFLAYGVYIIAILAAEIVMLIFFVTDGTRGPNRFGADPKAPAAGAALMADPAAPV